jgi:CelD/BcsL family acetyltransferase involved in cellulose biosynthesis
LDSRYRQIGGDGVTASNSQDRAVEWTLLPVKEFPAAVEAWNELNAAGRNIPLLDGEFFQRLVAAFASGDELIAVGRSDGQPAAMGILQPQKPGVWQTFQPSQSPLGAWIQSAARPTGDLLHGLLRALPGPGLIIGATQQDPLLLPRPQSAGAIDTFDYIDTASIEVVGDFETYWAERGKNLRTNIRRTTNRLNSAGTERRLEVISDPDELARAVDDFGILESSGWKAETGTALHPDNDQGRFYRDLFLHYASRGEASAYRYYFDDEIVAADLCIHRDGVFIILKTTYAEGHAKKSPAFLMRHEYFRALFDEQLCTRIEFYGKLMDWHTKWSDEHRTMYHINSYRSPLVKTLRKLASSRGR